MRRTGKRKRQVLSILSEHIEAFGENAQAAESFEDQTFWWERHSELKQERKKVRRRNMLQEPPGRGMSVV